MPKRGQARSEFPEKLQVTVTERMQDELREAAERRGLTVSALLRRAIANELDGDVDDDDREGG